MKNWISIASLLFLLCGLVLSSADSEEETTAVDLRPITLDSLSDPLQARSPKKKKGGRKGGRKGHKNEEDEEEDQEEEDQDLDDCNNGTTCAECFGQEYVLCPSSDDICYNPDEYNAEDACDDDDDDDDDSAASSLLPGRTWSLLVTIGALGLMTAML